LQERRSGSWARSRLTPESLSSLLLIKPGSFGDVIHALPCAAAIRQAAPKIRLTWLVDERWQSLLAGNPHIDETIIFPRQRFRGLGGKLASIPWAFGLRRLQPDVALDLQGLLRSGLMARLSGAKRIVGLSDAREGARFFHSEITTVVPGEHAVRRYLRSLEKIGIPSPANPEFWLPAGDKPSKIKVDAPYVLLHPFARGEGKSLSAAQVTTLCRALQPLPVVVAGMGESPDLPENAVNTLNRTSISELIWLIRAARFVISVDSGPMHIAAAVQTPLLSIHTWSDPRLVGPFNESAWIWQGGEIRPQNLAGGTLLPTRSPGDADIAGIAEFVKSR
jgi:ADP-heptose:LPS heptosyltransferase